MSYPIERPRRLRRTPAVRRMARETHVDPGQLVLPMFVAEGIDEPHPLAAMPGVVQHTRQSLVAAAKEAVAAGVGGLMLFGVPEHRDAVGSGADDPDGILNVGLRDLRDALGDDTVIMADLCLDEFTDHGHCGVLAPDGSVDNDATLPRYAAMAVAEARAGAHVVAPSGMMDGQVGVIRRALDEAGFTDVIVLAYSAKYASGFFGPFRDAVASTLKGDRRAYQQDPANIRESLREVRLDVEEGADVVMVKPAITSLDVLAAVKVATDVPVWAYQVSGEYAMIEFAAAAGALDRERCIDEAITAIFRAGADGLLTYWATEYARALQSR